MARLFEDSGICNELGQSVSLSCRMHVKTIVEQTLAQDPDVDLRELQVIMLSCLDTEVSRTILLRKRAKDNR